MPQDLDNGDNGFMDPISLTIMLIPVSFSRQNYCLKTIFDLFEQDGERALNPMNREEKLKDIKLVFNAPLHEEIKIWCVKVRQVHELQKKHSDAGLPSIGSAKAASKDQTLWQFYQKTIADRKDSRSVPPAVASK
jgi:hypothetical protein